MLQSIVSKKSLVFLFSELYVRHLIIAYGLIFLQPITIRQVACSCGSSCFVGHKTTVMLSLQAIFVDLKPDPIKILSIATIARSPTELDKGPWFYMDARKTPIFYEVKYNYGSKFADESRSHGILNIGGMLLSRRETLGRR